MKNLTEVTIGLCDNGYLVQYSYENEHGRYEEKKLVFLTRLDLFNYLGSLMDASDAHGNTGI